MSLKMGFIVGLEMPSLRPMLLFISLIKYCPEIWCMYEKKNVAMIKDFLDQINLCWYFDFFLNLHPNNSGWPFYPFKHINPPFFPFIHQVFFFFFCIKSKSIEQNLSPLGEKNQLLIHNVTTFYFIFVLSQKATNKI